MRTFLPTLALALAAGCKSDSKLQDDLDPGNLPTDPTGIGPDPTTPTPPSTPGTTPPAIDTADTGSPTLPQGSTPGTTIPTDPTEEEICALAAALSISLDPYQTPDDGHVVYCHAAGSHFNYIDSDISSCLPHLNHPGDVFPTSGCDS